jgi:hypothetical protein
MLATRLADEIQHYGIKFDEATALRMIDRLLLPGGSDEKLGRRVRFMRIEWGDEERRAWIEKASISGLYQTMCSERPGCIPITVPEMRVHYYDFKHVDVEIPADVVEEGYPWEFVEVEWIMYVRRVV